MFVGYVIVVVSFCVGGIGSVEFVFVGDLYWDLLRRLVDYGELVGIWGNLVCCLVVWVVVVICVDEIWLVVDLLDMWVGFDMVLVCVVKVFGVVYLYYVYLFVNWCVICMKVLIYDGIGIWLVVWCLN